MNLTIDGPMLVIEADHKWHSLQLTGLQAQGISPVCLEGSDEMMEHPAPDLPRRRTRHP